MNRGTKVVQQGLHALQYRPEGVLGEREVISAG